MERTFVRLLALSDILPYWEQSAGTNALRENHITCRTYHITTVTRTNKIVELLRPTFF